MEPALGSPETALSFEIAISLSGCEGETSTESYTSRQFVRG